MSLSNDLLSQFAKVAASNKKVDAESFVYGTVVEYEGKNYVRLDGSDMITPMSSVVSAEPGERVVVRIKNHSATVTGNVTSPASRVGKVEDIDGKTKVYIDSIEGRVLVFDEAHIDRLSAIEGNFVEIKAENAEFHEVVTDLLEANEARFEEIEAETAKIENLDSTFANIDFANIGEAALKKIFADSGLIKNLVVGDQTITGEFVGVTISADLINANTLKADKIVVKGPDGLYYKLNVTEGGIAPSEQITEEDLQNGLHGSNIIAKTITAEKVSVGDLVAFDATIGGFKITESSLYSGVKESIDNTTEGVYLDKDGQMNVGGTSHYLKYYKTENDTYKLEICAESIRLGSTGKTVEETMDEGLDELESRADSRFSLAEQAIIDLNNAISTLVTNRDGTSLMVQTENGWTFSTKELQTAVDNASEALAKLTQDSENFNAAIAALQQAVNDLGETSEYISITSYEDEPCIAMGESDSDFKILITNTRIMFMDGLNLLTYINNRGLVTENIEVKSDLRQGNFVWSVRANGNYGLSWKEVT